MYTAFRPQPNNSFKPNLLRYTKAMAEKACHGFGSTTQVGLTQALGRGTNVFSKPVIYMQIHAGHVAARRIGAGSVRKECGALSHPRTLMGDFMAVEACFRAVFRELASSGLFPVKPSVLVHLVPEAVGGYTNVEERAFQEAAASAGARICKVVTGRLPLSDSQVGEALR